MASISTANVNTRYNVTAKLDTARLAMERLNLVSDTANLSAQADAANSAVLAALAGLVGAGTYTVATSGVKITAPVTGSGTSGVTLTIVNGTVTAIVLS